MDDHEINKRLADVIDLRVTEHVRGDRLVWLVGGKQEWNPVEKIEQLWPLYRKYLVGMSKRISGWDALYIYRERVFMEFDADPNRAIALAIIAANAPSREGRESE